MDKIQKQIDEELAKAFRIKDRDVKTKKVSIIYNRSSQQYVIKLPRKFGQVLKLTASDKFEFVIEIPSEFSKVKPKLIGRLVYAKK